MSRFDYSLIAQTRVELHPLDKQITRIESDNNPLPTIHNAQVRDLPGILAVEIEVKANYIAQNVANFLKLKLESIPDPHYLDLEYCHHVLFQCKVLFKVGFHEEEVLCRVVNIKTAAITLGRY